MTNYFYYKRDGVNQLCIAHSQKVRDPWRTVEKFKERFPQLKDEQFYMAADGMEFMMAGKDSPWQIII